MTPPNNELNSVRWPVEYDSDLNWPAVTQITQDTGEEINRNRDAILRLERVLGLNPHIGLFTDPQLIPTATVGQRISLIEQGLAEGRFDLQTLNVGNVLIVGRDPRNVPFVHIGTKEQGENVASPVVINGPLVVEDSLLSSELGREAIFKVPLWIRMQEASTNVIFEGLSTPEKPLLHIRDLLTDPVSNTDNLAVLIEGNVKVINGKILGEFAIDHDQLLNIRTTPLYNQATGVITGPARHVARGDFHSHKKGEFNEALQRWIVDPNPSEETFGIINHADLEGVHTSTNQKEPFYPDPEIPYHVTGGDEHNHEQGRGGQIRHEALAGINPSESNHVTGGDSHTHTDGDGAPIAHANLVGVGNLTHADLDYVLLAGRFGTPSDNQLNPATAYRVTCGSIVLDNSGTTPIVTGLDTIVFSMVGAKGADSGILYWEESTPGSLNITHTSVNGTDEAWWVAIGEVTS